MKLREIQICTKCGLLNTQTITNKFQKGCKPHIFKDLQSYLSEKTVDQVRELLKSIPLNEKS